MAKTLEQIAAEVIRGTWGNGTDRKQKLTAAGYDYSAVQSLVNQKLYGTAPKTTTPAAPAAPKAPSPAASVPAPPAPSYEQNAPAYSQSQAVTDALKKLQEHQTNVPGEYNSAYSTQIDELLNKVLNREAFSYDFNADPLYQQYKDQYTQLGDMAMRDTMGNAAALSGGYGNSYAATAGQQAYQGYLGQLNNVIPELYNAAYNRYQGDGDQMVQQLGLLQQQDEMAYGRHRDDVSDYYSFLDYYNSQYQNERSFDYNKFLSEWDQWNSNRSYGYQKDQDAKEYELTLQEIARKKAEADQAQKNWQTQFNYTQQQDAASRAAQKEAAAAAAKSDANTVLQTRSKMYSEIDSYVKSVGKNQGTHVGGAQETAATVAKDMWTKFGKGNDMDIFMDIAMSYTLPSGRTLADEIVILKQKGVIK